VLDGSIGYTHDEISMIPSALASFFTNSSPPLRPVTTSGKIPKTPELTFNIGAELRTPLRTLGTITWRADFAHVSSQFSDIQNFAETRSPAHSDLNARIAFAPESGRRTIAVYGKNLTDETYLENGFYPNGGLGAQVLVVPSRPREIGLSFKLAFGR
jgi:iron complex outermembrane receptor protein